MHKRLILIDFDGVIADSFQPAFEVQQMICPHLTEEVYRKRFEGNINNWADPTNEHHDECRHDIDFFTEYIPRMNSHVKPFEGMASVLTQLAERNDIFIISSTLSQPIRDFLNRFQLDTCISMVLGNDIHTSKVEKINMVLRERRVQPQDSLFITDTLGDIREAQEARVHVIAVAWGFHERNVLREGKPYAIVSEPEGLIQAVNTYFAP